MEQGELRCVTASVHDEIEIEDDETTIAQAATSLMYARSRRTKRAMWSKLKPGASIVSRVEWMPPVFESANEFSMAKAEGAPTLVQDA